MQTFYLDSYGSITVTDPKRKPPNATPTGYGDELQYLDDDGFWCHIPPRTKYNGHSYSFDPITHFRNDRLTANGSAWSDRMQGWDYEKYERCANKHRPFGAGSASTEAFMRAYNDDPTLKLVKVVETHNAGGYSVYLVTWFSKKDAKVTDAKPKASKAPVKPLELAKPKTTK